MQSKKISKFEFGELRFAVQGTGVYVAGPLLKEKVAGLSVKDCKIANQEAWKMKRAATRKANACANVTIHGFKPHDDACFLFDVADAVCKETWKRMRNF